MYLHEEAFVRSFIAPECRERWLGALASARRRRSFLDRLNGCRDFDDRFIRSLPSSSDTVGFLIHLGAPEVCHVIADIADIDGQKMPIADAIHHAEVIGFGAILSCIAGRLAYYQDEVKSRRRLLLKRDP